MSDTIYDTPTQPPDTFPAEWIDGRDYLNPSEERLPDKDNDLWRLRVWWRRGRFRRAITLTLGPEPLPKIEEVVRAWELGTLSVLNVIGTSCIVRIPGRQITRMEIVR